jgi:hypothetical protein
MSRAVGPVRTRGPHKTFCSLLRRSHAAAHALSYLVTADARASLVLWKLQRWRADSSSSRSRLCALARACRWSSVSTPTSRSSASTLTLHPACRWPRRHGVFSCAPVVGFAFACEQRRAAASVLRVLFAADRRGNAVAATRQPAMAFFTGHRCSPHTRKRPRRRDSASRLASRHRSQANAAATIRIRRRGRQDRDLGKRSY